MKIKVKYTITGEWTEDSDELLEGSGSELAVDNASKEDILDECKEIIDQDPFATIDPLTDGKVTIKVEEA